MSKHLGRLLVLWVALTGFAACAEPTRVVYFNQPLLIENIDGKVVGPVADMAQALLAGLPDVGEPAYLSVKRVEMTLASEKAIGLAVARSPRRDTLGLIWIAELYAEDFRFATLAKHAPVTGLE